LASAERPEPTLRALVVEDDAGIADFVRLGLRYEGFDVHVCGDGPGAVRAEEQVRPDVVVLDWMLPGMDGLQVCKRLRDQKRMTPILFLSALSGLDHRVSGLDIGGDDYLTKPFAFRELEARVRALLRREGPSKTSTLSFLDITLDTLSHEVRRGEREITLTSKEYVLLELLMRHPGQVLSRGMITEHMWDVDADHLSNVIDVYIRYLRRKLCEGGEPDVIHTIRGFGYQLKGP